LEKPTNQESEGWKLDAHKFLPGLRAMEAQFPDRDWYLILDDDTYLLMENLHSRLASQNPAVPGYFGFHFDMIRCDGVTRFGDGPQFVYGGTGIILSRAAVQALLRPTAESSLDECIWRYRDCWAGDIRMALCLRDVNILYKEIFVPNEMNPGTPHWSIHNYDATPCLRPISFHHLHAPTMLKLYEAEQKAHARALAQARVGTSRWRLPFQSRVPDLPSPFYAPVHHADVWSVFIDHDATLPQIEWNMTREGRVLQSQANIATTTDCRELCTQSAACLTWTYNTQSHHCELRDEMRIAIKRDNSTTGIIPNRYHCESPTW
jgi:hypothetical protein